MTTPIPQRHDYSADAFSFEAPTITSADTSTESITAAGAPGTSDSELAAEDIYLSNDFGSPALAAIRRRLGEVVAELDGALAGFNSDDRMEADDRLNRARIVLSDVVPRLEDAEDGLGILITAVFFGLVNLEGALATQPQALALKRAVRKAATEPYLSSEAAAQATLALQDVGLKVDPHGLHELLGGLGE